MIVLKGLRMRMNYRNKMGIVWRRQIYIRRVSKYKLCISVVFRLLCVESLGNYPLKFIWFLKGVSGKNAIVF